jgi:hypothetical protein
MKKLEHTLLTEKFTLVFHENEDDVKCNAPNRFKVYEVGPVDENTKPLAQIDFQEGACKERGANGVANEDVLHMVLARLNAFQASEFACRENEMAATRIEEALLWLRKRTLARERRGVEGTHEV